MKDLIRKAGKKVAVTGLKAAEKAAPIAADAALKTGKVVLNAGATAFDAGSEAVANHKRKKDEERKEQERFLIEGLKQKYPGCRIYLVKFNPNNIDWFERPSLRWGRTHEIYDEYFALQYSIDGNLSLRMGPRSLVLHDNNNLKIGACKEQGLRGKTVSINNAGSHVMDVSFSYPHFQFSDQRYSHISEEGGDVVGRLGRVLMEKRSIKDYRVLAIADPARVNACMLLYTAMELASVGKAEIISPGGG